MESMAPYDEAATHMRALGTDLRASVHRLHVRVAAEPSNSCRTLWSMLKCLDKASTADLKRFTKLYDDSLTGSGDAGTSSAAPKTTRSSKTRGSSSRQSKSEASEESVDDRRAPRYCDVCELWCNGKTQYEDHLAGNKHLKNLPPSPTGKLPRRHPQVYQ